MSNYSIYIGIDCGVNTGYCEWNATTKSILNLETLKIHEAMNWIKERAEQWPGRVFVRVEDARQRKWVPFQKNEKAERGRREGAGSVKRDAKIWEDFLTDLGLPFEMVAPKNNHTKLTACYFNKLTGWTGKTNEHMRDSAMLVVGM